MGERRSRVHWKGRETNPPAMCVGGTEVPQAGWELVEDSDHGGSRAFQDGAGETGGSCGFVLLKVGDNLSLSLSLSPLSVFIYLSLS